MVLSIISTITYAFLKGRIYQYQLEYLNCYTKKNVFNKITSFSLLYKVIFFIV